MDTRQLAAFCAVVERKSFSQAAERLGVTQPAVSLQVRALEKRLGTQLLDRSGRRVEPTEAGLRVYRGAQRMLALEDQIVDDVAAAAQGELVGDLRLGASTGPAAIAVPILLCEFQRENPAVRVFLSVSDTHAVVERVASRELELGIVGAARRHRGVRFEPFFSDEVILACPPGHRFAGRTIPFDELREESLILMQDGAGVRQIVEDALRRRGVRMRDLDVHLELGLQESVRAAVEAGYGVTFISRTAVESDLEAGTLAEAHVEGLAASREISLASATGTGALARGRGVRRVRERAAREVIVRWGIDELGPLLGELGIERALLVTTGRFASLDLPVAERYAGVRRHSPVETVAAATQTAHAADGLVGLGGGSAIDTAKAVSAATGLPLVAVPTTYSGAEWTSYFGMRDEARKLKTGGSGARTVAVVYEPGLTLDLPLDETVGTALNALAHAAEALYPGHSDDAVTGARLIGTHLPAVVADGQDLVERTALLEGAMHAGRALGERGLYPRPRHGTGARRQVRALARSDERALPSARAALQRAGRPGSAVLARPRARDDRRPRPRGGARPPRWARAPA